MSRQANKQSLSSPLERLRIWWTAGLSCLEVGSQSCTICSYVLLLSKIQGLLVAPGSRNMISVRMNYEQELREAAFGQLSLSFSVDVQRGHEAPGEV